MRGFKLKALAVTLVTTFLLGSSVVMADTAKTIKVGTVLCPGDTFSVSSKTYLDMDDDPDAVGQGIHYYSAGDYKLDDDFDWDDYYGQWRLGVDDDWTFFYGYNSTDGTEQPVALYCNGGDGTQSNPYTFELVLAEDLEIQPGAVYYPGDSLSLSNEIYIYRDDSHPGPDTVSSGQYVFGDEFEWIPSWGQWSIELDSNDDDYVFWLGAGYADGDRTPGAIMCTGGFGVSSDSAYIMELVNPMYRLYNPNSGEHFYTANVGERNNLISLGWSDEGIGWYAPQHSDTPVYRLYNPNAGEHHYTTNVGERDTLIALGWNDEGIGWYSDDSQRVPLYRQYNPNAFANNHNYTTSYEENCWLISLGWQGEGIGWYGVGCA